MWQRPNTRCCPPPWRPDWCSGAMRCCNPRWKTFSCAWLGRQVRNMLFVAALRKELLEQWRSYRALVVAVVLLGFGLLSPLVAKFTPELFRLLPDGQQIAGLIPPPTILDAVAQ